MIRFETPPIEGDDRTVLLAADPAQPDSAALAIEVIYPGTGKTRQTARFAAAFLVGRGPDCPVRLTDDEVSRQHLEVYPEAGRWWVRDLESLNGTYLDGKAIEKLPLQAATTLELGKDGPLVQFVPTAPAVRSPARHPPLHKIAQHYFAASESEPAGEHTQLIRQAFRHIQRRQSRRYWVLIGATLLLLLGVGGLAWYQQLQLQRASRLATDIFYDMKTLELQVTNLEANLPPGAKAALEPEIAAQKRRLAEMKRRYDEFVQKVQLSRAIPLDTEERIILHVARLFGETEINVPEGFVAEVKDYIQRWKATERLERAVRRLQRNNYAPAIYRALSANGLPPQFLYLALQETNFRPRAVGPFTRYGYAKGMWQFIPETGMRYGLRPGPLQDSATFDPEDERHDFQKSTAAAARYLKDIYRTDAQASGLLVMASYNWGEGNIIRLIRQLPENPRQRNFWELLRHHEIPQETYDYVLYIFPAAVIGENPRLFGFRFDNPLQGLDDARSG